LSLAELLQAFLLRQEEPPADEVKVAQALEEQPQVPVACGWRKVHHLAAKYETDQSWFLSHRQQDGENEQISSQHATRPQNLAGVLALFPLHVLRESWSGSFSR
jgi:hypothetical protein